MQLTKDLTPRDPKNMQGEVGAAEIIHPEIDTIQNGHDRLTVLTGETIRIDGTHTLRPAVTATLTPRVAKNLTPNTDGRRRRTTTTTGERILTVGQKTTTPGETSVIFPLVPRHPP